MKLWKKFWLLFTVIWLVVAALNIVAILAFSEDPAPAQKTLWPLLLALAVPAAAYCLGWAWDRLRS